LICLSDFARTSLVKREKRPSKFRPLGSTPLDIEEKERRRVFRGKTRFFRENPKKSKKDFYKDPIFPGKTKIYVSSPSAPTTRQKSLKKIVSLIFEEFAIFRNFPLFSPISQ